MKGYQTIKNALAAIVLATVCVTPVLAQDVREDLPEVMQSGDITYMSGGVGLEERNAMKTVEKDYNLVISNANKKNKFTADITIVIKDRDNKEIFMAQDTGPLLYVKLPAGAYTVEAMNGDQQLKRRVTVLADKRAHVHFIWTANEMCPGKASAAAPKEKAESVKEEPSGASKHMHKGKVKKGSKSFSKKKPAPEAAKSETKEPAKEVKKEEAKKEDPKKEKAKESSKEESKKEESKKQEMKKEESEKEKAKESSKEESKKEEHKKEDVKKEEAKKEEAKKEETQKKDSKKDESKKKEESKKDDSKKDDAKEITKPETKDM